MRNHAYGSAYLKGKLMTKLTATFLLCLWTAMIATNGSCSFAQEIETPPNMEITVGEDMGDIGFDLEGLGDISDPDFVASGPPSAKEMAMVSGIMVGAAIIGLLGLLLMLFVAYLLSDALAALPAQFRLLPTWVPWLLLVPFINIVVFVLVFIKVPQSQSTFLASTGDNSMGDCGGSNGLWGVILYLVGCTFPIGLVLLVMSVLKINQAKKLIRASAAT
jgi:hypothetical protein